MLCFTLWHLVKHLLYKNSISKLNVFLEIKRLNHCCVLLRAMSRSGSNLTHAQVPCMHSGEIECSLLMVFRICLRINKLLNFMLS